MNIRSSFADGLLKIYFDGELDHHAAKKAVNAIEEEIDAQLPSACVIDMRNLTFMDSSGIAVILKTHRRMKEIGGSLVVENIGKQPRRVLDASGIDRIVKITASVKEA